MRAALRTGVLAAPRAWAWALLLLAQGRPIAAARLRNRPWKSPNVSLEELADPWPRYPGRNATSLAGDWDFCFVEGTKRMHVSHEAVPKCEGEVERKAVPGVMHNPAPGTVAPTGAGIYSLTINIPTNHLGLLQFHGCAFSCRVWVDGRQLADHQSGGYSVFWVEVPPADEEQRKLVVLAERIWDPDTTPLYVMMTPEDAADGLNVRRMAGGDMSHWGGLHRSVFLHVVPRGDFYLQSAAVLPQLDLRHVDVELHLKVVGNSRTRRRPHPQLFANLSKELVVKLRWGDSEKEQVLFGRRMIDNKGVLRMNSVQVPNPTSWSPSRPSLHKLQVRLVSRTMDDTVQVRFGLRSIQATRKGLRLNGQPLVIKGINRHSISPRSGSAMTVEELIQDADLLEDLGVNFVRGAHYQQDQRFLDLCDEKGWLVWEEPLNWGVSVRRLQDQKYRQEMMRGVQEMVSASRNHPSVVIWGLFNEGPAHKGAEACGAYQELVTEIRNMDKTRLVSWANQMFHGLLEGGTDLCEEAAGADLIAFNTYPGWYGEAELTQQDLGGKWLEIIGQVKANARKPVILSEFGAEGVYEMVNLGMTPYTQEYQAKLLQVSLDTLRKNLDGVLVWQFADIRASDANTDMMRWESDGKHSRYQTYMFHQPGNPYCARIHEPQCKDPQGMFPEPVDCSGGIKFHHESSHSTWNLARTLRPKGMNNKGLVDFWRRKKMSFDVVKNAFKRI